MDKELLEALNNLSHSLEAISKALSKESTSAVSGALKGGDFSKSLESITKEIVKISKDTTDIKKTQGDIIKSQNTIIKMLSDLGSEKTPEVEKKVTSPTTIKEVGESKEKEKKEEPKSEVEKKATSPATIKEVGESKEKEKREGESKSLFGGAGKDSSKIKEGVGTIVLIAAGVLAIGMAFKIIGKIDFASVLALSLALPLIAMAFQKISEMKLKPAEIGGLILLTVGMAAAIAGSSFFLSMVKPIGLFQGISAILISGVFVGLSYSLGKIVGSLKGVSPATALVASIISPILLVALSAAIAGASIFLAEVKPIGLFQAITAILIAGVFATISWGLGNIISAFKGIGIGTMAAAVIGLPLILVAVSYAIAKSSEYLAEVKPIGLFQALSSILIGVVFSVLGFGIGKMIQGFKGVDPATAAVAGVTMPLILIALTYAIKVGSEWLSEVKPIGLFQFFTALGISIVFVALGYAVKPLLSGVKGVSLVDMGKGVLVILALTAAIVAASYLINEMKTITMAQGMSFIGVAISVGIGALVMGFVLKTLDKMGTEKQFLGGAVAILIISTTIMLTSQIISLGDYSTYPDLSWTIGVVAAMLPFGIGMFVLGGIATGPGALLLLAGGLAIVGVALTVVATSHILKLGDYSVYPQLSWTLGTLAAMIPFGIGMVVLGALLPFIALGALSTYLVAKTIVKTDQILEGGNYEKYPSTSWSLGVGDVMVPFALGMAALGLLIIPITLGVASTYLVAKTIVKTAQILEGGNYEKYPSTSWSLGVADAMVPFALGMVYLGPLLPLVALGVGSMLLVAKTVVWTSEILNGGEYTKYPTLGWSLGTSIALGAFATGMATLGGIIFATFGVGALMLAAGSAAVLGVAKTIVAASDILTNGYEEGGKRFKPNYTGGPTKDWAEGIAIALGAFSPIYSMLMKSSVLKIFGIGGVSPDDYTKAIKNVSQGIVSAATFFASEENPGIWAGYPTKEWAEGVGIAIGAFSPVYDILQKNQGLLKSSVSVDDFVSAIYTVSGGIIAAAKFFADNKSPFEEGNYPSKEWGEGVGSALGAFAPVFEILSSSNNRWVAKKSISAADLSSAILLISGSIVGASMILKGGKFEEGDAPKKEWSEGVTNAIQAFGAVFEFVSENSGLFSGDKVGELSKAILQIGTSISEVSLELVKGDFSKIIDSKWISSIKTTIDGYIKIIDGIKKFDIKDFIKYEKSVDTVASSISKISTKFNSIKVPTISPTEWIDKVKNSIQLFADFISDLGKAISIDSITKGGKVIFTVLFTINKISSEFNNMKYTNNLPTSEWINSVYNTLDTFAKMIMNIGSYDSGVLKVGNSNISLILRTISTISTHISKMIYPPLPEKIWIEGVDHLIRKFGTLINFIGSYNSNSLDVGYYNITSILKTLKLIDRKIADFIYPPLPEESWTNGVDFLIRKIGALVDFIGTNYQKESLSSGSSNILSILKTIKTIDTRIGEFLYPDPPQKTWIDGVDLTISRFGSLISFVHKNFEKEVLDSGSSKVIDIMSLIKRVSEKLSKITFSDPPTDLWNKGIAKSIAIFGRLSTYIDTFGIIGLERGIFKVGSISSLIYDISKLFNKANFDKFPSNNWSIGVVKSIGMFSIMARSVNREIFEFDIFGGPRKIIDIAKLIFSTNIIFSKMDISKPIDPRWAKSVSTLISTFSKSIYLLGKISDSDFNKGQLNVSRIVEMMNRISDKFNKVKIDESSILSIGKIVELLNGITGLVKMQSSVEGGSKSPIDLMSTSFDNLSKSIQSVGMAINGLDISRIQNLVGIKGSSILINLISSEQFDQLVSQIEMRNSQLMQSISRTSESPSVKTSVVSGASVDIDQPRTEDYQAQILIALQDIQEVLGRGRSVDNYIKEKSIGFDLGYKK
jgi:hypothetical protein